MPIETLRIWAVVSSLRADTDILCLDRISFCRSGFTGMVSGAPVRAPENAGAGAEATPTYQIGTNLPSSVQDAVDLEVSLVIAKPG